VLEVAIQVDQYVDYVQFCRDLPGPRQGPSLPVTRRPPRPGARRGRSVHIPLPHR
jgi:hypothetical protein